MGSSLHIDPFPFDPDNFGAEKLPFTPVGNRIYIPRIDFELFDAFATTGDAEHVIFLQLTTAKEHDLKTGGIHAVIKYFPKGKRQSTFWIFLFVSHTERAKHIVTGHVNSLKGFAVEGEEITVNIGSMVIRTGDAFDKVMVSYLLSEELNVDTVEMTDRIYNGEVLHHICHITVSPFLVDIENSSFLY